MNEWCFMPTMLIKIENYRNLVIASVDTYDFACALYYFGCWIYSGLKELWIVSGKSYPSTRHIWQVRYRGSRHFTSIAYPNWQWQHKQGWDKSFWTVSSNWKGSETAFWLWKRWIVGEHDCNGRIFLDKVHITCNRVPNIWWIEASFVSHQQLPIRYIETSLHIECYSFAYSQSILRMLSLIARTI